MTTFLLIRHGLTEHVGRIMSGRMAGVHLNAEGRRQASEIAERLGAVPLRAVVAGPLERVQEMARPLADAHGLAVTTVPALDEFEFGDWTGQTLETIAADPAWQRFNAVRSLTRTPSGESMLDVQQRSVAALVDLHARHPEGNIAVVSHGDVIRAVLMYFLGIPIDFLHRVEVSPARISIAALQEGVPRVLQVNGDNASLLC
jgi:probable phosphoglycerate mutase